MVNTVMWPRRGMEYDYVIVGGGLAGMYAAYKLRGTKNKALFESTFRLGGRALTNRYQNLVLDYGPTRFQHENHTRLLTLLRELNIPCGETEDYNSPPEMEARSVKLLNPAEFEVYEDSIRYKRNPCKSLLKLAFEIILDDQWDFKHNHIFDKHRHMNMDRLKQNGTYNGKPLWKFGIWDLLCNVLTVQAVQYIKDNSSFYHMIEYNINAMSHICSMLDILAEDRGHSQYSLSNGMEDLSTCLHKRVAENTTIFMQHKLTNIAPSKKKSLKLTFTDANEKNVTVTTKRVFLCLNAEGMSQIHGCPTAITRHVHELIQIPLFKLFVVVDIPSWKNDMIIPVRDSITSLSGHSDGHACIPCREVHYRYDSKSNLGQLLIYGDFPSINFWKSYCVNQQYQVQAEPDANPELRRKLEEMLTHVTQGAKFEIKHVSVRDWSLPPYNAGVHFWKPGADPLQICKEIRCVHVGRGIVHVCGEAFNFKQGYVESALESVDEAFASDCRVSKNGDARAFCGLVCARGDNLMYSM